MDPTCTRSIALLSAHALTSLLLHVTQDSRCIVAIRLVGAAPLIIEVQESITATITLEDDDQSTVKRMLTYLYTLDYDDGDALPAVPKDESPNTDIPVPDSNPNPDANDEEDAND